MTTKQKQPTKRGRRATLAALALALGGAVYLNWSYAQSTPQAVTTAAEPDALVQTSAYPEDAVAVLDPLTGEAQPVTAEGETEGKNYGEAQLVSVSKDSGSEFFEQARLARSKARDEALDTLNKTLKSANLSDEEKNKLTEQLNARINNISVESSLETLIKAKGFVDCVVTLGTGTVNVTVMTENDALTAEEVTRIRDAILGRCTGITARDITVVEVK